MAAECRLSERRIVEIKMGKSKFPGKPSKIGNRKRVNLSSCALPEENESSKAAENIYLGLSVFNEAFGDNEMADLGHQLDLAMSLNCHLKKSTSPQGPFLGFSAEDVEDSLAEARLQQRESEIEYKKQGISFNLQESFQYELSSITGCFSLSGNHDKNKIRLCFDGGGVCTISDSTDSVETGIPMPLISDKVTNSDRDNSMKVNYLKTKSSNSKDKIQCRKIRAANSNKNIFKLSRKQGPFKSLQSRAAKKLLQKAKMSNLTDVKSGSSERKFILPSYSMHSLRVIKPNKKFLEDTDSREEVISITKPKSNASHMASGKRRESKSPTCFPLLKELRVEIADDIKKKNVKEESGGKVDTSEELSDNFSQSCSSDSTKTNVYCTSSRKLILREPKLQLNRLNLGLTEGPFSSSSRSSSLSPNSQLNANLIQTTTLDKSINCGVCGSVKFYKFVELAKKFGIYCCEPCQKFITKIIKAVESDKNYKLKCLNGKGCCVVPPLVKSQNSVGARMGCEACWLKLCLQSFKISHRTKIKLLETLPVDMQLNINMSGVSLSTDGANAFGIGINSVKHFKWLSNDGGKTRSENLANDKTPEADLKSKEERRLSPIKREKSVRRGNTTLRFENRKKRHRGRTKSFTGGANRQRTNRKGPRVKNVCRSASVVLGQPIATFPRESSPKKQANDSSETVKNCDEFDSANGSDLESSNVVLLDKNSDDSFSEKKRLSVDKKSNVGCKEATVSRPSPAQQGNIGRTKRKPSGKTENPISIDFWEAYDPDEVCETGFGLIGSDNFSVRALCFLCGSSGREKLVHCASCCEPYHEFCVNEENAKLQDDVWKYDWVCPRCTICETCGKSSGQQLKCVKCDHSYHTECVDRVGGRLLHSPDRPWVCSVCLRCKSCNGVDVSVFVGNLPLCKACFALRQKGNYCPLCQRCYEDDDYDCKMMECGRCKCWVHAKCEGLSDEKYQVLSFLPESVEYICRMCCVMPPAPWWIAVEAELKSGYLGVLKALSKNRKACAMLKWSPPKQCTCRQANFTPRNVDSEEARQTKTTNESAQSKGENYKNYEQDVAAEEKVKLDGYKPGPVLERKTSVEVINHSTEGSLKLTLKIMKGTDINEKSEMEDHVDAEGKMKHAHGKFNIKECSAQAKKSSLNEDEDSHIMSVDYPDENQDKNVDFITSNVELPDKRSLCSPLNPSSDSGIGSTDDELKANSLTDEESCRLEDNSNRFADTKTLIEPSAPLFEEKNECVCFLEVDSYNSRSKPFSPSLLSIKKKVITSEYSSLQQFHMDMQRMIGTTQSAELMEMYHQTVKEIFPWFDPKCSKVNMNSQKISNSSSPESTPKKSSPTKSVSTGECKVLEEKLSGQPLEYYYSGYSSLDIRSCLLCKSIGDGTPNETGRLLYCGQNEWVHCNCALWSAEVFEEIDGSLQNVHSAINRGRSIRCPECNLKGASIGCCARNCTETFHFPCARKIGCAFMDDKTVFCPAHLNETKGKIFQNEKEFEIRRPVYVELDKRKMKSVDSSNVRFAVGGLQIENLGRFVKLSDHSEAIIPDQFQCTRLFWSCFEPWKIVRYHFSVRIQEDEENEGVDYGINLTVDHSKAPEIVDLKLKQVRYFHEHKELLEINEPPIEIKVKEKRKLTCNSSEDETKAKSDELKCVPAKRAKKENKIVKKIVELFDPREEESCLSDSQNTADLIPPELEEAIFKDLPNDILDGISMQDIFMDIKNDSLENGEKEGRDVEDALEVEEMVMPEQIKSRKTYGDTCCQNEMWTVSDDSKQNVYEWTDETCPKSHRDLKRSRSDVFPIRKNVTLRNNQRSCSLNWNCKMDIHTAKWKRSSKCNTASNLLESQERGNMLQELKYTDGLVMVSTDSLTSVKDLKDRLSIQQEEGKENKCLPWHLKLQPRLLQVDGGVDSSSSGSEAGESPQRLTEENVINPRAVPPSQPSPFSSNTPYSELNTQYASSSQTDYNYLTSPFRLPQIDGMDDSSSDESDFEYFKPLKLRNTQSNSNIFNFKITQLDGSADSEKERKINPDDVRSPSLGNEFVKDEPVKCRQCHCTYRTKLSYERHLENCSNDYILFSSDGEGSEEEIPFHTAKTEGNTEVSPVCTNSESTLFDKDRNCEKYSKVIHPKNKMKQPVNKEETPVKKEKTKRPQVRRKPSPKPVKAQFVTNSQNVQSILVQQNAVAPAVIVQDLAQPNLVSGTFIDTGSAMQYITSLESQSAFTKPQLITTPSAMVPGGFHVQLPEPQLVSGLPILPQNVQANLPGIIIQQPQVANTLISPQPPSVFMSSDQMMLGVPHLMEVVQDPHTGAVFLASHNQPIYYNMETIVSNTVMQTNQYVSNVVTGSSFSQTSTQVVQTSKLEQVMNVPSHFILVGQNTASDKVISSSDIICLPASQPLIQNQSTVPTVVNPVLQPSQTFNNDQKIVSGSINPTVRCIQPLQSKGPCPPQVINKVDANVTNRIFGMRPCVTSASYNHNVKQNSGSFRSMPMMRPNVAKSPPRQYEKALIVPKSRKTCSKPVTYVKNIKSEKTEKPSAAIEETSEKNESTILKSKENELIKEKKELNETEKPQESVKAVNTPQLLPQILPETPNQATSEKDIPVTPSAEKCAVSAISPVEDPVETSVTSTSVKEQIEEKIEVPILDETDSKSAAEGKELKDGNEAVELKIDKHQGTVETTQTKENNMEVPSKDEKSPSVALPLQETVPPANNTPNIMSKTTDSEIENLKDSPKVFSPNQNFIATKLVTIHPRLIQSPEYETESENKKKYSYSGKADDKGPKLIFDVISDDGFKSSSTSMAELWAKICDSVQGMRAVFKIPPLPISRKGYEILGMQNHGLQHCLEQLRGVENCVKYKCKYFVKERSQKSDERLMPIKENLSGCARTEIFCDRKEYDMFAWLASRHRRLPKLCETSEDILSSARRANSLPMAMRYRHLREAAKTYVGVYRSKIHGKGLFCLREIEAGEMVIEYAGEVIRSNITDKREKYYTDKGIGCYMFRIDDHFVVDATMKGNAARFINHSCEPNCYSRVVDILGKKHIVIFALRRIRVMEELTYDYKFPFEDEKISCHCLSKKCRKYLN